MPYTKKATVSAAKMFASMGKLNIPLAKVEEAVENGATLEVKCSSFEDSDEYSMLFLNGERIGYWGGY